MISTVTGKKFTQKEDFSYLKNRLFSLKTEGSDY